LFWKDSRYRLLETFATQENAQALTDGAELTLFIWREFGESPTSPTIQGPSISQVIESLRESFKTPETSEDCSIRSKPKTGPGIWRI
jgi:hypothetical protein